MSADCAEKSVGTAKRGIGAHHGCFRETLTAKERKRNLVLSLLADIDTLRQRDKVWILHHIAHVKGGCFLLLDSAVHKYSVAAVASSPTLEPTTHRTRLKLNVKRRTRNFDG